MKVEIKSNESGTRVAQKNSQSCLELTIEIDFNDKAIYDLYIKKGF